MLIRKFLLRPQAEFYVPTHAARAVRVDLRFTFFGVLPRFEEEARASVRAYRQHVLQNLREEELQTPQAMEIHTDIQSLGPPPVSLWEEDEEEWGRRRDEEFESRNEGERPPGVPRT